MDDKAPSQRVWDAIERSLGLDQISIWNSVVVWRAAAMVLLGLSIYAFWSKAPAVNSQPVSQQEFRDIESFYSGQIMEKVSLLSSEGQTDDSFTQDFQKLEAMYAVLADEMKKDPSEKVKDALVLNMLVRIDLLNQQIQKLEESKKTKDKVI
ncbi:MAG: hypothetical protein JST14_12210 [Bacteroidetes bacterium]|nr:hypothetical protein [Bacteroidota bacterium]